jgi:hypothetical protein
MLNTKYGMTQNDLNKLYESFDLLHECDKDKRLKKIVHYYVAIANSGGKTIHYTLESNDTASQLIFHMKQCGIPVLNDPAFASQNTEFCVIVFY